MQPRESVPEYLHETFDMLKCTFPEGIPEKDYWSVMALLHPHMSFWTITDCLAALTDKNRYEVYNDASGFGLDPLPHPAHIENVRQILNACGYAEWVEKNTFLPPPDLTNSESAT
jgi:hypothetical protein